MKNRNTKFFTILLLFIVIFFSNIINAQQPIIRGADTTWECGFEAQLKANLLANPSLHNQIMQAENAYIYKAGGTNSVTAAPYQIPVVFHIIDNGASPITYQQILWQLAAINSAFANNNQNVYGGNVGLYGNNTQISFCLAKNPAGVANWSNTNEHGVMRYSTTNNSALGQIVGDPTTQAALLAITHSTTAHFPFANYLNIWVVPNICGSGPTCGSTGGPSVIGYATFPIANPTFDGVVMRSDAVGDNSYPCNGFTNLFPQLNKGRILVHEIGHYLGLFHTFQCTIGGAIPTGTQTCTNGCYGTTGPLSTTEGDYIADTPPTSAGNINIPQGSGFNTCLGETYAPYLNYGDPTIGAPDQVENYMSYNDDDWMNTFTRNQTGRMWGALDVLQGVGTRSVLVSPANITASGINNAPSCGPGVTQVCFNTIPGSITCGAATYTFVAPSGLDFPTTYNWNFGDGTTSTTPFNVHTYTNTTTNVTVTLVATNINTGIAVTTTTVIPLSQISVGISQNSNTNMCRGSEASITIRFGGPTNLVTLNKNGVLQTINKPLNSDNITITEMLCVNTTYSLTNACNSPTTSVTFSVVECGMNLVNNGDFSLGNTGFTSQLGLGGSNNGCYSISTPAAGMGGIITGNALFIDGVGISSLCSSFPVAAYCYNNCSVADFRRNDYQQTINGLQPNTQYYVQFKVSKSHNAPIGTPNTPFNRVFLELNFISGTSTLIATPTLTVPSVTPQTTIPGSYEYTGYSYAVTTPSVITGTYSLAINQVVSFADYAFDYYIDNVEIRQMNTPPLQATANPSVHCNGLSSSTLTATGDWSATNFTWTPSSLTGSTITVSPTSTTSYTVTGNDNCFSTAVITVSVIPSLNISASPSATICSGTSVTLTATGAATYSWNTGTTTSTLSVTPTVSSVYTVTGTNGSCIKTQTINVTVNTTPTVAVSNVTICSGKTATLTAIGANTYIWNPGAITSSVAVVSPTITTNYTVTGTTNGCANTKTVTVTVNPSPTVTAVANPTSICVGQTSTLTAGGATTYSWSTTSTNTVITVTPTITTTYTAYGFFANGCSSTKTVSVIVGPVAPTITASSSSVNVCSGNSTTLTANGAANYTWTPGGVNTSTYSINPSSVSIYTLSGNYGVGCNTATTTILVNPVISTLCCSAATSTLGTSLTNTVSVPAGTYTTSSAIIYVQGCITFTANTSYSGYTFRMAPGASIRVYPNKTLTLTNCKLYSCSELWDGIYLINDMNYWCGNIIVNNSTIEDMYNGIVMDYNNMTLNPSAPSGTISITGSTLNKNYVSVQMRNNNLGFTGSATNDYLLSLKTSTISSNASATSPGAVLKPSSISSYTYAYNNITNGTMGTSAPYVNFPRAFIGIKFDDLCYRNNALVGDFVTGSNTNTFDNLDFGVNGTNVSTKVSNNYFKNITGSAKQMDLDSWTFPATGPDEIGIAVAITETATANYFTAIVGDNNTVPSGGNPFPKANKFEDCNKGIQVKNTRYTTAKANYFTATTTSTLVQTTTGTPPMQITITNPNTYYFYKAQNAEYITSIGTTANMSYNFILNHATGIYANHTIVSGGVTPAMDITNNDISAPSSTGYCMQAIQVDQAGGINFGTDKLYIYNNAIEKVYRGIIANGVLNGLLIKQNPRVFIESTSKTLNYGATQPRTAIILTNCQNGYVKGNVISSNTVAPTSTTTAQYMNGVYITNSINSKVECNYASLLGRCFVFQQTCSGSSWKVNAMSNSYTGLEIRTAGVMGQQGASSGTPNLSANTWTNITRQTNAVSSPSVNVTSKLFLLAGATTQPTLNFSQGGSAAYSTTLTGINTPTAGTSYTCNSGSAQRLMNGDGNSVTNNGNSAKMSQESDTLMLYTLLASQDEDDYEFFPEEMTYLNKQSVFKLLEEDSIQAVSGTVLENFYQNQQNSAIDKLTEVQNAIANYDTTNAVIINTSVATKNTVEYKHQRANELVLKYMQNHAYVYNSTEMSELFSMASECIAKGYYVVQCRSLVNIVQNTVVNFADNCEEEANASRKMKPISEESIISKTNFYLYPNPNNGDMILDYDLGADNNGTVELMDITGKLITSYKMSTNKGILELNERNLMNGVYFYRILVKDKVIKTDKLVIIK